MLKTIRKFFAFCGEENRKKFVASVWLGVIEALFGALKIPAVAVGVKDRFGEVGKMPYLREILGMTKADIVSAATKAVSLK